LKLLTGLTVILVTALIFTSQGEGTNVKQERNTVSTIQLYSSLVQKQDRLDRKYRCIGTKPYLVRKRLATWNWQDKILVPRTRTSYAERKTQRCGYLRWAAHLWASRADASFRSYVDLQDPRNAICHVFGIYCTEALRVSSCESGHSIYAHNGQYLGMFQMGSGERARYGHGNTPLAQAIAAYRYFVASGRDWSPWSCRP